MLRRLAVKAPHQLVMLDSPGPNRGRTMGQSTFSYPMYKDLRDNNRVFSGILARMLSGPTIAQPDGQGLRVDAELVSGNYFDVLGVEAHLGRVLNSGDDLAPGAHGAMVLAYEFWKNRYAADPGVIGRTIRVNGYPFEVVGVAQPGFYGLTLGAFPAVFAPTMMKRQITPTWDRLLDRRAQWLHLFARLKTGVSPEQAQAALQPYYRSVLEEEVRQLSGVVSEPFKRRFVAKPLLLVDGSGGSPFWRREAEEPLTLLLSMVGLVLLIACANVANLLLARSATRQKEISVRLALGAGRWHLVRQLLSESAVLAVAGGFAGFLTAAWTLEGLLRLLPKEGVRNNLTTQLDLPARRASRVDPLNALRYV